MPARLTRILATGLLAAASAGASPDSQRLASLRRSVQNVEDLNVITTRYGRFVDQATDPAVIAVAKRDLTEWQDRAAHGWVKVGEKWVSPDQRDALAVRVAASIDKSRELLKQNKPADAMAMALDALAFDVDNVSAFYLLGVINGGADQLPAARRQFEFVLARLPDHTPTLNNLAVIEFRQRRYLQAAKWIDGAIVAVPGDKTLLDNAASMLEQFPPEVRPTPVAAQLVKHFIEQDQKLARQLAGQGLQRVGSRWLTAVEIQNLDAVRKQFQDRLDKLATDFDAAATRVRDLDRQVDQVDGEIRQVTAATYAGPYAGFYFQVGYPPAYYRLVQDADRLRRQRGQAIQDLDSYKTRAEAEIAARDRLMGPTPLQFIGVDGTPTVPIVLGKPAKPG